MLSINILEINRTWKCLIEWLNENRWVIKKNHNNEFGVKLIKKTETKKYYKLSSVLLLYMLIHVSISS